MAHSRVAVAAVAVLLASLAAGCGAREGEGGPNPRSVSGMSVVAEAEASRLVVHTQGGDRAFLAGVNLPDSAPGYDPGELPRSKEQILSSLEGIHAAGVRTVRIFTIQQPRFYEMLRNFNLRHRDDPLYLVVGVYLPDVDRLVETSNLADPEVTAGFSAEIRDAVAAVHGDLEREQQPGRAYGTWRDDVSQWVVAWLPGIEVDGAQVQGTDQQNPDLPVFDGTFFRSTSDASPTERWYAARLDELAAAEAAYGTSAPVGFVNWPTADPLSHPYEPLASEDLAGIDATHVLPTDAWPGGTFASFNAYPYYPDFLRHEPDLQTFTYDGRTDPYAGYLAALRDHCAQAPMPFLLTEFGVPSSIGSAHNGPLGRSQGDHSESDAMAIDAQLLQMAHDLGLAGGLVFAWEDEWFKRTWNTMAHEIPADRRRLWHNAWTNEQWFGVNTIVSEQLGDTTLTRGEGPIGRVELTWDHTWITLRIPVEGGLTEPVRIAVDVVPGGPSSGHLPDSGVADTTSDYVVVVTPGSGAQAYSRQELDGVLLDAAWPEGSRPYSDGWVRQQLTLNRALVVPPTGESLPPELQEVGTLREGPMDPEADGYDSRNTWRMDSDTLEIRLPWASVGISDPSSRQALVLTTGTNDEGSYAEADSRTVETMGIAFEVGDQRVGTDGFTWEGWEEVDPDAWSTRLKVGADALLDVAARLGTETAQDG